MNTTTTSLISIVNNAFAQLEQEYIARRRTIEAAYSEKNDNIEINIDRFGRWHSPVEGYCDPESGELYGKGVYIPMPEDLNDPFFNETGKTFSFNTVKTERVLIETSMLDQLDMDLINKELKNKINLSCGKKFSNNGTEKCYLYIQWEKKRIPNEVIKFFSEYKKEYTVIEKEPIVKGIAPTGKQTISGIIGGVKIQENYYYNTTEYKMLVVLENKSTVYGTIPASVLNTIEYGESYDLLKGKPITFTASFEHAEGDNTHAFYKRPSKVIFDQ